MTQKIHAFNVIRTFSVPLDVGLKLFWRIQGNTLIVWGMAGKNLKAYANSIYVYQLIKPYQNDTFPL